MAIRIAESDGDISACFPVMGQLRPHLHEADFVDRIRRQQRQGYQLVMLDDGGSVVAVAGLRLVEYLAWGKAVYVDDLVTDPAVRSKGYGKQMFEWIVDFAKLNACDELHLDSGVQRFDAHRFYLRNRMNITSHHFALDIRASNGPHGST